MSRTPSPPTKSRSHRRPSFLKRLTPVLAGVLVAASIWTASAVRAADLPADDVSEKPLPRATADVVVQAVRADAAAPITRTDIPREEIVRVDRGQEMPFLLQEVPSLTQYSESGAASGYSYFSLRGIRQTRINQTLDGVPLAEQEDYALYFTDFGNLNASLQSIQVQRGVGTSTVGAASFGGSVNFASIDLTDRPSLDATLSTGSWNSQKASAGWQSGRFGDGFKAYARLSVLDSAGFRDHSGMQEDSLFFGLSHESATSYFKLFGFTGRERSQLSYVATDLDVLEKDLRFNPMSPNERDDFRQTFVQGQFTRFLGNGASLALQLFTNVAGGTYQIYADPEQTSLYNYGLSWRSLGGALTFKGKAGPVDVTWGAYLNDFVSTHTENPVGGPEDYRNHGYKNEANTFLKLGWDSGQWHVYGDAQLRWARFRYEGNVPLGSVSWTFFNPKLGARYDLGRGSSVFASIGQTGREPARSDLLDGEDNASGVYDLHHVKPETVTDVEAGYELKQETLTFKANLYAMEFRDEIALTGEQSPIGYDLRRNVDRSYRRGVELEGTWQALPSLRLRASANLSRNRIRTWTQFYDVYDPSGNVLGKESRTYSNVEPLLTPEVTANLGVDWSPTPWVTLGALGRYVNASFLDNTNAAGFSTPTWLRVDASVRVDLSKWVPAGHPKLRLSLENLLNNDRILASGYSYLWLEQGAQGSQGASVAGVPSYFPLATRSAYVSLDVGF